MTMFREYHFQYNGINYISSVDVTSPMYQRIKNMPENLFIQMNLGIIKELINVEYTLEDIHSELDRLNKGGTYAFLQLGENN